MYNITTNEEIDMDLFLNALQDGEIILDNRDLTEEERKEILMAMAEHRAMAKSRLQKPGMKFRALSD